MEKSGNVSVGVSVDHNAKISERGGVGSSATSLQIALSDYKKHCTLNPISPMGLNYLHLCVYWILKERKTYEEKEQIIKSMSWR
jgi:hypothetical protein